ncbi:alpha/beta hydrolase family protein [Amycolatopsis sp. 3B14]|uniref:alpha/beta hydrolase family protein n=1 Tax=Amycolatopsis sp. 3B14 TaxID=3243600 RepID=UPI003D96F921
MVKPRSTIRSLALLTAAAFALTVVPASADTSLALPAPSGPFAVGVTELHLVDQARDRELMATVRYPAIHDRGPRAPYLTPGAAAVIAEADAARIGMDPSRLDYGFATNARSGAPVAAGRLPVVLYTPGAEQPRALATTQLEELASRGYVTVAFDHPGETSVVEFPDGRLVRGSLPPQSVEVGRRMIATRVADARFVLDQLEVLARGGNPDVARRALPARLGRSLDLTRIGMFGHSAGGFTTAETMLADPRIDAGANLDGSMAYSQRDRIFGQAVEQGLDRPFLLMSAGDHSAGTDGSWQEFLDNRRGPVEQRHLAGGEHFSYTDYQFLLPRLGVDPAVTAPWIGDVDAAHSLEFQRTSLVEFFGQRLYGCQR